VIDSSHGVVTGRIAKVGFKIKTGSEDSGVCFGGLGNWAFVSRADLPIIALLHKADQCADLHRHGRKRDACHDKYGVFHLEVIDWFGGSQGGWGLSPIFYRATGRATMSV